MAEPDRARRAVAATPAAVGDRGQVDVVVHAHVGAQAFGDRRDQAGTPEAGHLDVVNGLGAAVVGAGHAELDVADPAVRRGGPGTQVGDHVGDRGHRVGLQEVDAGLDPARTLTVRC